MKSYSFDTLNAPWKTQGLVPKRRNTSSLQCVRRYVVIFWLYCFFTTPMFADKNKHLERHIPVDANQTISIQGISGANITFKSWDKPEIFINLMVQVSASDKEEEQQFIDSVKIIETSSASLLSLSFFDNSPGNRTSGVQIFGWFIGSYFKREISGEIYVPQRNALSTNARYTNMFLENMQGEIQLSGRSNSLSLINCANLRHITNDYGKTIIKHSGGTLDFKGKSGSLGIEGFNGGLILDANYTGVQIQDVKQDVRLKSRSASIICERLEGSLRIDADYSTISVNNVKGYTDVESRSATIVVRNVGGASIRADYSNIELLGAQSLDSSRSVSVSTRSGSIKLENVTGRCSIEAPHTKILLKNIQGDVSLSATNSRVWVDGLKGNWTSSTSYTECSFQEVYANTIWMSNRSAAIDIKLRQIPRQLTIMNEYGEARVFMPQGFTGHVSADAQYGQVETNLQLNRTDTRSSVSMSGVVGGANSKQPGTITIKTRSANIKLFQL